MTANSAVEMNVPLQQPLSIKNESCCPLGGLYTANVTSPTWQTGEKRSRSHHTIKQ